MFQRRAPRSSVAVAELSAILFSLVRRIAASGTITKCTLELGGKSASIVLDDVDFDYAVDGALWGVFFHNGQVCSAGTRLLVDRKLYDDFVAELAKRASEIRTGSALDPASDVGPIVSKTQLETVERYEQTRVPRN